VDNLSGHLAKMGQQNGNKREKTAEKWRRPMDKKVSRPWPGLAPCFNTTWRRFGWKTSGSFSMYSVYPNTHIERVK